MLTLKIICVGAIIIVMGMVLMGVNYWLVGKFTETEDARVPRLRDAARGRSRQRYESISSRSVFSPFLARNLQKRKTSRIMTDEEDLRKNI